MFSAWPEKSFNVSCDCGRGRWCFETAKCLYFYYVGVASVEFEVLFFFSVTRKTAALYMHV